MIAMEQSNLPAPDLVNTAGPWHNLPESRTELIGREREVAALRSTLPDTPLLTLVGSGGSGKTRLALRVAEAARAEPYERICWVDLAPLDDPALLPQHVAAALSLREQTGQPLAELLAEELRRHPTLLVLDNCEHLRGACCALLAAIIAEPVPTHILATSRAPLGVPGEQVWPVAPLSLPALGDPPTMERLWQSEAVRLFVARARAVLPSFQLDEGNQAAVAQLCRLLDGLPLAIELAAARAHLLTPAQLAERLAERIDLSARRPTRSDARHESLRGALDWSFALLQPDERALFPRLAVFAGGFDLPAAEAVCGASGLTPSAVLDLLAALVEQSLVVAATVGAAMRYRLLEPIRQYAVELLEADRGAANWRERHRAYYLALAEQAAPLLRGSDHDAWHRRLSDEHDNLRAALRWCLSSGDTAGALRLCSALGLFWERRCFAREGSDWLDRALALGDEGVAPELRVRALTTSARLLARQSSFVRARARFDQALERAEATGDRLGALDTLIGLGAVLWELGTYDEAQATLEAAVQGCRAEERPLELSRALGNLALVHQYQGKVAAARAHYAESIALTRQLGDEATTATTLFNLAQMAEQTGDYLDARLRYDEVLAIRRQHNDRPRVADTLINVGNLLLRLGDSDGALAAFDEAEEIYRTANSWGDLGYIASGRAQIAAYAERSAEARRHYHDALGLFRMVGNQRMVGWALASMGSLAAREGQLAEAAVLFADAASIHSGMGNLRGEIALLEGVASELALAAGQPALAARLLGAAASAHRLHGQPPSPQEGRGIAQLRSRAEAQLGDPGFARAWADGEALSLEQAMGVAREALAPLAFEPSPAALRVFALGPLRVYRGETQLTAADWKYTKASELVLFLLLHPGATREQIGLALWPDASPGQLRQRLSVALAHARRALGRERAWITLSEGRYRVADGHWFDVDVFTLRLREARQRLARDRSDERGAQLLAEAVALYQHEPAGAVADEGWLEPHRVELRAAYLDGLLSLAQLHTEQGRHAEAARLFERALAHEPTCEEAALGAMEAYQSLGDARRALACYSMLLAALAEIDATPAAALQALAERLRSGDSAARAVHVAPARHH